MTQSRLNQTLFWKQVELLGEVVAYACFVYKVSASHVIFVKLHVGVCPSVFMAICPSVGLCLSVWVFWGMTVSAFLRSRPNVYLFGVCLYKRTADTQQIGASSSASLLATSILIGRMCAFLCIRLKDLQPHASVA